MKYAKGLLDFSATLITLPITLLKNLLGYIAGLLGFDGIKEAIDNFSFKDMIDLANRNAAKFNIS